MKIFLLTIRQQTINKIDLKNKMLFSCFFTLIALFSQIFIFVAAPSLQFLRTLRLLAPTPGQAHVLYPFPTSYVFLSLQQTNDSSVFRK